MSQWLLPTALLTFVSFASFWVKPEKCTRLKFLITIFVLLYLHILYINNKSSAKVSYSTASDCWFCTCIWFVVGAFVEYGIVTIVGKMCKQNKKENRLQNSSTNQEGDTIARVI